MSQISSRNMSQMSNWNGKFQHVDHGKLSRFSTLSFCRNSVIVLPWPCAIRIHLHNFCLIFGWLILWKNDTVWYICFSIRHGLFIRPEKQLIGLEAWVLNYFWVLSHSSKWKRKFQHFDAVKLSHLCELLTFWNLQFRCSDILIVQFLDFSLFKYFDVAIYFLF